MAASPQRRHVVTTVLHGGPLDGHDLGFSCQAIDHTSVIALPYGDRTRRAVYRSSTFGIQTHWEFTGIEDVKPTKPTWWLWRWFKTKA